MDIPHRHDTKDVNLNSDILKGLLCEKNNDNKAKIGISSGPLVGKKYPRRKVSGNENENFTG